MSTITIRPPFDHGSLSRHQARKTENLRQSSKRQSEQAFRRMGDGSFSAARCASELRHAPIARGQATRIGFVGQVG